jgi:hypothetical protein
MEDIVVCMMRFGVRDRCKEREILTFFFSLSLSCLDLNRKLRSSGRLRRNRRGAWERFGVSGRN